MNPFDQLGPYRIGKPLGRGGMGTVYEGFDTSQGDQRVAVKVLHPQLAVSEGFRDRFGAEIESLKKLRHPHIVRLFGYGEQHGWLFYSMERVAGPSLEEELRAGRRFGWREATRIGVQVAKALKHAHDHGVIHRDIKPSNLLLSDQDCVKLSDFGIARLFGGESLTNPGGVVGTAEYMAPEQAEGRPVRETCDQYSLGCVLYALLAGRPPFRATGQPELLQLQRFAQPEPVRSFAADVPVELDRIVMQLLEKDPDKRFRTTVVVARQLEAMERALTRLEIEGFEVLTDPESMAQSSDAGGLGETRAIDSDNDYGLERSATQQPAGPEPAVAEDPTSERRPPAEQTERRFTTVGEEADRDRLAARDSLILRIVQGVGLAVGLVLLIVAGWYLSRPPSADALYDEIMAAAEQPGTVELLKARTTIDQFLDRFPDDPRWDEVAGYNGEIELDELDQRLRSRARRSGSQKDLSPVQQLYIAAIGLAESDPEQAIWQLEALVHLYHDKLASGGAVADADDSDAAICVRLAQSQLDALQRRADQYVAHHLKSLDERLRLADRIRTSEPERARRMWQAIVQLYDGRSWAEPSVARARAALAASQLGSAGTPTTGPSQK